MEQVFWDRKEGARCVRQAPSASSCALPFPLTSRPAAPVLQPTWSLGVWT